MKENGCARRQEVSLFAANLLTEAERQEVAHHIAACAECRSYCETIKAVTLPLANWKKDFSRVEVTDNLRRRWSRAVRLAAAPRPAFLRQVYEELILPCRRLWLGLAAVWVGLLVFNARMPAGGSGFAGFAGLSRVPSNLAWTPAASWEEDARIMADLTRFSDEQSRHAEPVTPPASTRPRSERPRSRVIV